MKLKRLLAFTLSMTMMVSSVPVLALADETSSETTETTVVETAESEEKEMEKATTKETTKETEKPFEAEDKKPEETEAGKPSETVETKPSETEISENESTKPSESEETQPSESKEDKIVETEKGKAVTKKPKAASTLPEIKINLSADGMLSWEPVEGADHVSLYIRWDDGNAVSVLMGNNNSPYNLKAFIDLTVVDPTSNSSKSAQSGKHYCDLSAYPEGYGKPAIAKTEFVYNYKSPEQQITMGTISNVRISPDGIMEWDPYAGADDYEVWIDGNSRRYTGTKCDLNELIEYFIKWSNFEVKDSYEIVIKARMKLYGSNIMIARWSGRYPKSANSMTVTPKIAKVKYKKLKKKKQTVARAKVMNVSNAQGNVSYKLAGVKRGKSKKYKKYFKINATTGNVTIKKKLKKGTYKITCVVSAAGNTDSKAGTKTVTFTIKVK